MKPFDVSHIKPDGIYLFSFIEKLTGITRQTLRKAADQQRLIVFRDRPSMTKGAWFLDYLTDRRSLKSRLGGTHGQPKRLPRVTSMAHADSARSDMVGNHQSPENSIQSNAEVKA